MSRRTAIGPALILAAMAGATAALGQGRDAMRIDIGQLTPSLEPEFTQWRTGEGAAAEWTVVSGRFSWR